MPPEDIGLSEIVAAFVHQLESGQPNPIECFLEQSDSKDREFHLARLLQIELDFLKRSNRNFHRQEYLDRFPNDHHVVNRVFDDIASTIMLIAESKKDLKEDSPEQAPKSPTTKAPRAGQRFGKYEMQEFLGKGGFGHVWRAFDPFFSRAVALKLTRSDKLQSDAVIQQFFGEARKLSSLSHDNIIKIYDVDCCEGVFYIAEEYIAGGTLQTWLETSRSYADLALMFASILDGLHAAHTAGLVHSDVKPANVLVAEDGRPVLADFGLAMSETEQLEGQDQVAGSVPYMSPEQISGKRTLLDHRTDLYSVGVCLYQALAGRQPFLCKTFEQFRDQIQHRPIRPVRLLNSQCPPDLEVICLHLLAKRVEDRPTTAADAAAELRRFAASQRPKDAPQPPWRWWVPAGLLAFVVLTLPWWYGLLLQPLRVAANPALAPVAPSETGSDSDALKREGPILNVPEVTRRPHLDFERSDWHPLLTKPPHPLLWRGQLPDFIRFNVAKREMEASAKYLGLLDLGQNTQQTFELDATFVMLSDEGQFGIFYDLRPDNEGFVSLQAIMIDQLTARVAPSYHLKAGDFSLEYRRYTLGSDGGEKAQRIANIGFTKRSPSIDQYKMFRLSLSVVNGLIEKIRGFEAHNTFEATLKDRTIEVGAIGRLGIIIRNSAVRVSNVVLKEPKKV